MPRNDQPQFALQRTRSARDEALLRYRLTSVHWTTRYNAYVQLLPPGWEGTGEQLRLEATKVIGKPLDANAWGSACMLAQRDGLLEKTGKRRPMRTEKSHARMTDVLRRSTLET